MPPIVSRSLKEIGLADKEVAVLLVLLEQGPTLAATVAKLAKLNRTTTYGLLKELAGKGLVSQSKKEGTTRWQSIAPEMLPGYIKRRRDALAASEKELSEVVPQLQLLRRKGKSLPKVQFFEGEDGIKQAYEDTLVNNQGKTLYEITGIESIYTKLDPKFVDYYPKERVRRGIKSYYIAPESEAALRAMLDDEKLLREVRFIPAKYKMDTEIAIYDDKVCILSFSQESPVAVLIEDATIAQTMKTLFDFIETMAEKK